MQFTFGDRHANTQTHHTQAHAHAHIQGTSTAPRISVFYTVIFSNIVKNFEHQITGTYSTASINKQQ